MTLPTSTERLLASINTSTFLKEFSFDKNQFRPSPGAEVEFADGALWLKEHLVVFQIKERAQGADSDEQALRQWFNQKVKRDGTRQIRSTLAYLRDNPSILLTNAREHQFNVNTGQFKSVVSVVIYQPEHDVPEDCAVQKYHISTSTGDEIFVHIISLEDYSLICELLLTPIEIVQYFLFREKYLRQFEAGARKEKWLLGRFLMSPVVPEPSLDDAGRDCSKAVDNLQENLNCLEVRKFLERMGEKWERGERTDETEYYAVLIEFALLNRVGLSAFDERLKLAIRHASRDEPALPYSFEIPERRIGYVVVSLTRERHPDRQGYLVRLAELKMYERKLEKCAGVSVVFATDKVEIDWCYGEKPWSPNPEFERYLKENGSPFRKTRGQKVLMYGTKI